MKKVIQDNIYVISGFVAILLIVVPFFLISFYSVPSADDYETARESLKRGYITYQIDHWTDWNGRYTSTAIQSAPLLMNFVIYGIIPFILFGLFIHATYLLLRNTCLLDKLQKMQVLLAALFLLAIYCLSIPITSNFYWLSGSATYFLPTILFLYLLSVLYKVIYKGIKSFALTLIGSFLIFFIVGTSETAMLLLDIFLLVLFLIYILYRRKINWSLVAFETISFISSLIVVLAPGNAVRKSNFSGGGDISTAVIKSVGATIDFSHTWLFTDSILWLFTVVLFGLAVILFGKYNKEKCGILSIHPLLALVFVPLFTFVGFFVPYFSFGSYGPERTLALIQFVFVFSLLYVILVLAHYFVHKVYSNFSENVFSMVGFFTGVLFFTGVFIVFSTNQNLRLVYNEIFSGKVSNFYDENKEIRDILISSSDKKVALPRPSSVPQSNSFRGDENFRLMAKYHMKKYDDSMQNIAMKDYKIIQRNLSSMSNDIKEQTVFFDEQSKSLIYRIKKDHKNNVDVYKLSVFPKNDKILYGEEQKQGYSNQSFSWNKTKSAIDEYLYFVKSLPKNWEIDKIVTGQTNSENEELWSIEIKL